MTKIKHPFLDKISSIENKIDEVIQRMKDLCPCDTTLELFDTAQVMKIFRIDSKTCKKWRDEGILPFTRIKNKMYYKVSDLHKMIEKNKTNNHE